MLINKKTIALSSVICAALTGCGGSDSTEIIEEVITGFAINASNASSVIQTGVVESASLTNSLLDLGNEINTGALEVASETTFSTTYYCDDGGTVTVTTLSETSLGVNYDDCIQDDVHFHGDAMVQTTMHSGSLDDLGSYSTSWSATQTATLTDLARTAPASSNPTTNIMDGDVVLHSSYNTSTQVYDDLLTSTNLTYDLTAPDGSESSYEFSNLSYRVIDDNLNGTYEYGLDFTANHSELGDIELITEPRLSIEFGSLESGQTIFSTGESAVQLDAIGNDEIAISVDVNNDGTTDFTLPNTSFVALFGE